MKPDSSAHNIAALILAAGSSSRLGQPKQLIAYNGKPLVQWAAESAVNAGASRVVVVTGAHAESVASALDSLPRVETIFNPAWGEGLSSSLRAGLRFLADQGGPDGILVTAGDQPHVTSDQLAQLVAAFRSGHRLVAAEYNGVIGVPALFGAEFVNELLQLRGDAGAGKWLRARAATVRPVPMTAAAFDVDNPEHLARLKPGLER